jgi:hypothetical protein
VVPPFSQWDAVLADGRTGGIGATRLRQGFGAAGPPQARLPPSLVLQRDKSARSRPGHPLGHCHAEAMDIPLSSEGASQRRRWAAAAAARRSAPLLSGACCPKLVEFGRITLVDLRHKKSDQELQLEFDLARPDAGYPPGLD